MLLTASALDLTAAASIEGDGDSCVGGDAEWEAVETYTAESGCVYTVSLSGQYLGRD